MWDIKLPNGIIQVYNIIKNKIINYIMHLEIIDFTKNQQEIIEERLNFFIINLQCFKKVHKYQLDYMKKINIINSYGIKDYVRLKYLLGEPL